MQESSDGSPQDRYQHHVGGDHVQASSQEYRKTTDPATGTTLAKVADGTPTDIEQAVGTARDAFADWRETTPRERSEILDRIAIRIREQQDELARIECLDQGKPLTQARGDVESAARFFEYYAGTVDSLAGRSIPVEGDAVDFTVREPYGVSGQITPWNFPIRLAARGIAPALAAGNTVVVKPAPTTPLSTLHLSALCAEAGLPDGVLNVVTGGAPAGAALSSSPGVDTLTFTGSLPTGQRVMESAAETITPVTLELGGKNPAIVFPDADLDEAVTEVTGGIFLNAGQVCSAADRAIVHESIYDEFVRRVVEVADAYDLGAGIEDRDMGPLNHESHADTVRDYIDVGRKEGATLETGRADGDDLFVRPTVFSDVESGMRIAQEEIFGPVLVVIPFTEPSEAVEIANDVRYGLTGGVFSRDVKRALRVARSIDAGSVSVNEWFGGGIETPFGGFKRSGIGREKGQEALDSYLQTKNISLNLAER